MSKTFSLRYWLLLEKWQVYRKYIDRNMSLGVRCNYNQL